MGAGLFLALLPSLGTLFLLLDWLVQFQHKGFCLVLLYLIVVFDCCLLEACSFLNREDLWEKGGWWKLREVEGGETVAGMHCMREE